MIEQIYKAIARKIGSELGSNYRVEVEERPQGFQSGTFFITSGQCQTKAGLGTKDNNVVIKTIPLTIYYFTSLGYVDCASKGEILSEILEWLELDENILIRSTGNLEFNIEGGVLTFTITYKIYLKPNETVLNSSNTFQFIQQGVNLNE